MWNFEGWWVRYLEWFATWPMAHTEMIPKEWARENVDNPNVLPADAQLKWETRECPPTSKVLLPGRSPRGGYDADVPGYEKLRNVLERAYDQAAVTKGAERHANDRPFHEQPMQAIADRRGIGFILGQVDKKTEEGQGMIDRGENEAAVRELLGAIVYLAGAVIFLEK